MRATRDTVYHMLSDWLVLGSPGTTAIQVGLGTSLGVTPLMALNDTSPVTSPLKYVAISSGSTPTTVATWHIPCVYFPQGES